MKVALLLSAVGFLAVGSLADPLVVCYHEYWTHYRPTTGRFSVKDIDPSLCSHIVYAYFGVENNKIKIIDGNLLSDLKDFAKKGKASTRSGGTKTMMAIGSGAVGTNIWSTMAGSDTSRSTFVTSVVAMLDKYQFNGVMIDWMWPGATDKDNYVKLLSELKTQFRTKNYILGVTGPGTKGPFEEGFDAKKVDEQVDFIHVLSYDFHGPWPGVERTGHAAPLFHPNDDGNEWPHSASASLKFWAKHGVTKSKLLMSLPTLGRTFTLADPNENDPGDKTLGAGPEGQFTKTKGMLAYYEICSMITKNPNVWTMKYDKEIAATWASSGNLWVSFDDSRVANAKAYFVVTRGFGGVVLPTMGNDDFRGVCNTNKNFTILKEANKVFASRPTVIPETTTMMITTTRATPKPGSFTCKEKGIFPDPKDCHKYHICTKNEMGVWEDDLQTCPAGQAFHKTEKTCKAKKDVPDCK